METGCLAILDWTAKNAKEMLRNFYRKGYNSWQKGVRGKPYAYVIPEEQGDRRRVAQMVNVLHRPPHRGRPARRAGDGRRRATFATGSYVVRLDQPYRNYAVDLLEPQKFPARPRTSPTTTSPGRCPSTTAWKRSASRTRRSGMRRLTPIRRAAAAAAGRVAGDGPVFLLQDTGQEALLAARLRLARFRVEIAEKPFAVGRRGLSRRLLDPARPGRPAPRRSTPSRPSSALDFESAPAAPAGRARTTRRSPRVAVWHPGPTPSRSAGCATRSTRRRSRTTTSATRRSAPAACAKRCDVIALRQQRTSSLQGADPRHRPEVRADALQEDARDPEPRRAGLLGGHHRRDRLGRHGASSRSSWTRAACSSRSATAPRCRSTAARPRRAARLGRAGHARRRAAREVHRVPTIRSPTAIRRDVGVPHEPARLRRAARRTGGSWSCSGGRASGRTSARTSPAPLEARRGRRTRREGRKTRDDRTRWSSPAACKNEGDLEGRPAILDLPAGKGPRDRLQLQPDSPRPQPLRLPHALERHPELERAAAGAALRARGGAHGRWT